MLSHFLLLARSLFLSLSFSLSLTLFLSLSLSLSLSIILYLSFSGGVSRGTRDLGDSGGDKSSLLGEHCLLGGDHFSSTGHLHVQDDKVMNTSYSKECNGGEGFQIWILGREGVGEGRWFRVLMTFLNLLRYDRCKFTGLMHKTAENNNVQRENAAYHFGNIN